MKRICSSRWCEGHVLSVTLIEMELEISWSRKWNLNFNIFAIKYLHWLDLHFTRDPEKERNANYSHLLYSPSIHLNHVPIKRYTHSIKRPPSAIIQPPTTYWVPQNQCSQSTYVHSTYMEIINPLINSLRQHPPECVVPGSLGWHFSQMVRMLLLVGQMPIKIVSSCATHTNERLRVN